MIDFIEFFSFRGSPRFLKFRDLGDKSSTQQYKQTTITYIKNDPNQRHCK